MKKSRIVLVVLTISILEFFLFLYLHLSHQFEGKELIPIIVMGCAYLVPVVLCLAIILSNKAFQKNEKIKWSVFVILTYFVGCFYFYIKYGKDFDRIIGDQNDLNKKH
jgi:hypothetical protein